MKKVLKGTGIALAIIAVLMVAAYCFIGFYYKGSFPCFTWINGIYCTGKTVQEVNSELVSLDEYSGIAVLDDDSRLFVSASDVDLKVDYTDALSRAFPNRSPLEWGVYLMGSRNYHYEPTVTLDKDKLEKILSKWDIFVDPSDYKCRIVKNDEEGYALENAFVTVPDAENVAQVVYDSMISRESVADLSLHDECYKSFDLRGTAVNKMDLYNRISDLQDMSVTYRIGNDEIVFDSAEVSDIILTASDLEDARQEKANKKVLGAGRFIIDGKEVQLPDEENIRVLENVVMDENGNPIISEKKLYAFFENLAQEYDSKNLMDLYRKGETDTIVISRNSRGNGAIIDVAAEFEYLKNSMLDGGEQVSEMRELGLSDNIITVDAPTQLGNTYIEVNMGDQELSYYVDGKLDMSFPIVTGNVGRGRGTPTGIYNIYNKRYHTYLRGADYVSYVNYWLGVHKGIGIHDATWRDKFGGEIYRTAGSHGCINCPLDQAAILWEKVEVDTPVILYY